MLKNSPLSKDIQEKAWHMFIRILEQKAKEHGRTIVYIDQWFASSKTCNTCGYKNENLELKDRIWTCPQCNTQHDRGCKCSKKHIMGRIKRI